MRLSHSHSRIAVFDPPEEVSLGDDGFSGAFSTFRVGPLEYEASFDLEDRGVYTYVFALTDIHGTPEEIHALLEKIWGKKIESERVDYYYRALFNNPTAILGTGSASRVLGNAIAILKKFIEIKRPYCVMFNSWESSRTSLYTKMIQRYLSGMTVESRIEGGDTVFYIYPRGKKRK